MTEDEAKKALFKINEEYMLNPPDKRLELYDEYKRQRGIIQQALAETYKKKFGDK